MLRCSRLAAWREHLAELRNKHPRMGICRVSQGRSAMQVGAPAASKDAAQGRTSIGQPVENRNTLVGIRVVVVDGVSDCQHPSTHRPRFCPFVRPSFGKCRSWHQDVPGLDFQGVRLARPPTSQPVGTAARKLHPLREPASGAPTHLPWPMPLSIWQLVADEVGCLPTQELLSRIALAGVALCGGDGKNAARVATSSL